MATNWFLDHSSCAYVNHLKQKVSPVLSGHLHTIVQLTQQLLLKKKKNIDNSNIGNKTRKRKSHVIYG